jgi:hypothetical protein
MRKRIADLHRRTEVSQKANERLLNALASVDDSRSVEELTAEIQKRTSWNGRKVRGLHPWGDDKELFAAINHGEFTINGFRNRNLQALLYDTEPDSPAEERRRRSSALPGHRCRTNHSPRGSDHCQDQHQPNQSPSEGSLRKSSLRAKKQRFSNTGDLAAGVRFMVL